MTRDRNNGKILDVLVRRNLRASGPAGAAGKECPEPETLAAYFDRALSGDEVRRWEAHFSVCVRCQVQLAALARSEPAAAPQPVGGRAAWLWNWRWLAPTAAALAALALWVTVRPVPPRFQARVPTAAEGPVAPVAEPTEQPSAGAAADELAKKSPRDKPGPAAPAVSELRLEARRPPVRMAGEAGLTRQHLDQDAKAPAPAREVVQEMRVPTEPEQKAREKVQVAEAQKVDAEAARAAKEELPARAESVVTVAPPPAGAVGAMRSAPAATVGGRQEMRASFQPVRGEFLVATPDPKTLWRLGPAGKIERSTDASETWLLQTSLVESDLLAGSAPSANVCWAVGSAGVVLRTTDGKTWEKVASPVKVDIVAVRARDAESAVITTAEGRSYVTSDGGRTWRPDGSKP